MGWRNRQACSSFGGEFNCLKLEKEEQTEKEILIEGLLGKADALYYAQEYDKALQFIGAVVSLNPDDAIAQYNKGVALGGLGRIEEALQAYEEAIRLNPDYFEAFVNKAMSYSN